MIAPAQEQVVPVRLYQSDNRLMAAMPMPGLEPQDISVTIRGNQVHVHGEYRGPRQAERDLLVAEWAIGPYFREVILPDPIDGARTNATYGNGVLVLVMPKLAPGERQHDAEFRLEVFEATRGAHIGHTGQDLHATTTAAHLEQHKAVARNAALDKGSTDTT